ncbi:hypothetical protein [Formosa sp. PL04]|uniref:hypothetical protein n=1 Tax=Formosa sp. PL04 TaxID=3081755 RepID=UPI002981648B|nr:hypothetical protein [Formosa sp. PL04]MDW5287527.1 hypothetical protein [Formosa sp. PL04]
MFLSEFEQKVNHAKQLDFGIIFSQSIDLFKKVWVQGLITILLSIVAIIPIYCIIYIPLLAFGIDPEFISNSESVNVIFLILTGVFFFVFAIIASAISMGLMSAFYRICKQKDFEEIVKDDYFYYFKKAYFLKLIKLALVVLLISIVAAFLCVIPLFYAFVPLSFITVIFAFNPDQSVTDIVKASFKLGNKKWLITFGLFVICGFLAQIVGMLMCFIGLFATASFTYIPLYIIYKEVIGVENSEDQSVFIETTL